jgi:NADH-quinone oxidoreductase subunit M
MELFKSYLLIALIALPAFVGMVLLTFQDSEEADGNESPRTIAFGASVVTFLASLPLVGWVTDPKLTIDWQWIESLGVRFHLEIDGVSVWLVLLATLLTPLALLASRGAVKRRVREFSVFVLFLETGLIGVFLARDLILFYLFWEIVLIPMYFLIGVWGSEKRIPSVTKFFVYTVIGSLLMLAAMIALYVVHGGATGDYTFDLTKLTAASGAIPVETQTWLFLAFAVAFLIKMPVFPFHTWQADAYAACPTSAAALLAAVMSKMGAYGLIRFGLTLFPDAAERFARPIMILAVISIVYGALIAIVQTDFKRMLAYSSLSHLGFVVLGIFSFTDSGLEGAVFQMAAHGVTTGALFLLAAMLEDRRGTTEFAEFGGLAKPMPKFAVLLVIASLASAGLPLTNGFVGEFLTLLGAFLARHYAMTAIAATGMILSAVYLLKAVQRIVFGEVGKQNGELADLDFREIALVAPLIALIFVMGVAPNLFLNRSRPAVTEIRKSIGLVDETPVSKEETSRADR